MEPMEVDERRGFEDLWKQTFPVGTDWNQLDSLNQYNWKFSNLQDAFQEGGVLYGKKVYIFSKTEPQYFAFQGQKKKAVFVPSVIAVISPFPPSHKLGIFSINDEYEEIFDMKEMKMDWVPYIPIGKRSSPVETLKSQIFILTCFQRRSALKHLNLDRVDKFQCSIPYFYNPLKGDDLIHISSVDINYPTESKPVVCKFDWEINDVEEYTNDLIAAKKMSEDQKDTFMEFVKKKVAEEKIAIRKAKREKLKKARDEMSEEEIAAFENMRFYKFYPVATPDSPDVSSLKYTFINRYYGHAHQVL